MEPSEDGAGQQGTGPAKGGRNGLRSVASPVIVLVHVTVLVVGTGEEGICQSTPFHGDCNYLANSGGVGVKGGESKWVSE